MDPLSAVGLASNILQFVEFSVKLIGKGVEIYSSADGATVQHADLRASLDNLRDLAAPFRQRNNLRLSRDPDEMRIVQTAVACNEIAHGLENALDDLIATPHSRTSSVLKALQSVWEQGKIDDMVRRLESYRSDLQLLMMNAVLNRQSFLQRSIDTLKSNNDELGIKSDVMLARVQDLKDELRDILHTPQHHGPGFETTSLPGFTDNILRDKLGELYAEGQDIAKTADMLRSLRFHRMTLRRHNVAERHVTTLEWVYEKHHAGQRLHLREWLERGKGVYWVTGNAGSGKSTLMKFIYLDSRTKRCLQTWAGQRQNLVMADFFFWKPGAELERSQSGLLRSLLYEVLRQMPAIMPRVLGPRWDEWIMDQPWTLSELQEAFRLVGEQSRSSSQSATKFCFFVDGLDEYMGQSHEIAQAVQELGETPNIKLCVSSRPWNTFEAAFGHDTRALLRVHEHNREDIRRYVHEILGQHRSFQQLVAENHGYQRVLHKIVDKAKGVFLWVFLVVRNLKESLPNEDTVNMLERIVDDFPSELEDYFERMLDTILPRYHEASSRILLDVMESGDLLPLVLLAHVLPDGEGATSMSINHLHSSRKLRARLKAYCGDLMTVVEDLGYTKKFEDCHERIDFLHRTVNDYLHSPAVKSKLQSRVPQPFNPTESLLQTAGRYLGVSDGSIEVGLSHPVVEILISQAAKLEDLESAYDVYIVDEVRKCVVNSSHGTSNRDFIKLALRRGLYSYVRERFKDTSTFGYGLDATWALRYVLFEIDFHGQQQAMVPDEKKPRMLRALLERGADPNDAAVDARASDISALQFLSKPNGSIWVNYVDLLVPDEILATQYKPDKTSKRESSSRVLEAEMCGILIEHGAEYDAVISRRRKVKDELQAYFASMPREVERFELLARRWRRRGMVSWTGEQAASSPQLLRPGAGRPQSHSPEPGRLSPNTDGGGRRRDKMRDKLKSWLM
ncbi:hypothetical protein S7711_08410 [Stachybotrys chartarum IBT 7711]|uniref:Uncharacterized protein n=1 Tax=Stachybotrys chartarum (strain CBS 109288 / IBT 7711) TaxID=1280523 RepID=A0A084AVL3_STACB|nr:hypothetical protein S7711_08410 [Stachybotrys chartarum IBT 7711]